MDDCLLQQFPNRDLTPGEAVLFWAHADKRLFAQAPAVVARFIKKALDNGKVQPVFVQKTKKVLGIVNKQRQFSLLLFQKPLDLLR